MCTILIVDDDVDTREAIAERLRDVGHSVLLAMNGSHALDLLASSRHLGAPPCVALIDLQMPVMDGWELLAALERDGSWRKLRVIVSSGSTISDGPVVFAHAKIVWEKPIDPDKLEKIQDQCPVHGRPVNRTAFADRDMYWAGSEARIAEAVRDARRGAKRSVSGRRVRRGGSQKPVPPRSRPSRSR
jgi:CheY-like chemotaxis protein